MQKTANIPCFKALFTLVFAGTLLSLGATPATAFAGPCGDDSCWQYVQSSAGDAEAPADVLKVLQTNKLSPAVQESLGRIMTYVAAGITPAVFVKASHWQIGYFQWTGATTCSTGDARLKTNAAFSHEYCLSNGVCIPGKPVPPADVDPCAA